MKYNYDKEIRDALGQLKNQLLIRNQKMDAKLVDLKAQVSQLQIVVGTINGTVVTILEKVEEPKGINAEPK